VSTSVAVETGLGLGAALFCDALCPPVFFGTLVLPETLAIEAGPELGTPG